MLRVFKLTSPMNVGSWILTGFGAATTLGAARELGASCRAWGGRAKAPGCCWGGTLDLYGRPDREHGGAGLARRAVGAALRVRRQLDGDRGRTDDRGYARAQRGAARRLTLAGSVAELAATAVMER